MLIVCPSCASSYSLSAERLGAGRQLRCASCRHVWFARPPGEDPAAEAVVAPEPEAPPAAPAPAKRAARRPSLRPSFRPNASLAAGLALLLALGLAVAQRRSVVAAFPQTARLFAAVGLPVNLRGLALENVRAVMTTEKDQTVLLVEGDIRGAGPGGSPLAPLQVSVRDEAGRKIFEWTSDPPAAALGPGQTAPFRARAVAPPAEGKAVMVRFAERDL